MLTILMWLFGMAVAPYILAFPPVSYEGFGLVASVGWGVMVGAGSALMLIGQLARNHVIETPGVVLISVGLLIYTLLSWEQVVSGSPGSGTRALLLGMFFCWSLIRADKLLEHGETLRRIDRLGRGR